jgi:hypothetical protein
VGEIRLVPTAEGLVAEMTGSYAGMLKLTTGDKLHGKMVAGRQLLNCFTPTIRILLK